jgi:hypothetical protein
MKKRKKKTLTATGRSDRSAEAKEEETRTVRGRLWGWESDGVLHAPRDLRSKKQKRAEGGEVRILPGGAFETNRRRH